MNEVMNYLMDPETIVMDVEILEFGKVKLHLNSARAMASLLLIKNLA